MSDLLSTVLSGGLTGILGTALSALFGWLKQRDAHKREMQLRKLDLVIMQREAELAERVAAVEAEREETAEEYATLRASYAESATRMSDGGSRWLVVVDVVRGLTRPGLTVLLVGLTGAIYYATEDAGIEERVVASVLYITTAAVLWWFGSRQVEKAMAK